MGAAMYIRTTAHSPKTFALRWAKAGDLENKLTVLRKTWSLHLSALKRTRMSMAGPGPDGPEDPLGPDIVGLAEVYQVP